jgi:hypothetical protein
MSDYPALYPRGAVLGGPTGKGAAGQPLVSDGAGGADWRGGVYLVSPGRLGIGIASPVGAAHVVADGAGTRAVVGQAAPGGTAPVYEGRDGTGTPTFAVTPSGDVSTTASGPAGSTSLVQRKYVESRGQNLVTNGSGLIGSNYNFSSFTFDPVETHGGKGSFKYVGLGNIPVKMTDEYIPVDPEKFYRFAVWAKAGNADGSGYNAGNKQYAGLECRDADLLAIDPRFYSKVSGSTDTTLAAPLNPGDTTVSLTTATGWNNNSFVSSNSFVWWPYTNGFGYTYPDYTYSRNNSGNYSTNDTLGTWAAGGITGNTITLRVAWAGPALPSGTPVRNRSVGGNYKYIAISNQSVPNAWTRYEGYIGGFDTAGSQNVNQFPYGTAYIRPLFLCNYTSGDQTPTNVIRWSNVWLSEMSAWNLDTSAAADAAGAFRLVSMADASAPNSSLYYSTTQSKLVWKNSAGVVNALY